MIPEPILLFFAAMFLIAIGFGLGAMVFRRSAIRIERKAWSEAAEFHSYLQKVNRL